jgi:hypothetical protein
MESGRICDGLKRLYGEGHRLDFWHDPEREFQETLQDRLPKRSRKSKGDETHRDLFA